MKNSNGSCVAPFLRSLARSSGTRRVYCWRTLSPSSDGKLVIRISQLSPSLRATTKPKGKRCLRAALVRSRSRSCSLSVGFFCSRCCCCYFNRCLCCSFRWSLNSLGARTRPADDRFLAAIIPTTFQFARSAQSFLLCQNFA